MSSGLFGLPRSVIEFADPFSPAVGAAEAAYDGDYTGMAIGAAITLVRPLRIGSRWAARDIADAVCERGCEAVARQIQRHIGGDVVRITPMDTPILGGFRGKNWGWSFHEVVLKDGRVYDITTGHQGLPIDEYKKLWQYADSINFGF